MDRRKWVLTTEEGQYVQVMKVNQSLELYLDDTHQPTHWIIRKQEKKRLLLFYEYESSLYVLTFVKDSRKLHLKCLHSKEPLHVTSDEHCQLEIGNSGRGDFYTLRFGERGMFLATQGSRARKEIGLTEDATQCLYIRDEVVCVNILWSALNATVQAPPPSGSTN